MTRYWAGRILQSVPLLFFVSVVVFGVMRRAPGDQSTRPADPRSLNAAPRAELAR